VENLLNLAISYSCCCCCINVSHFKLLYVLGKAIAFSKLNWLFIV